LMEGATIKEGELQILLNLIGDRLDFSYPLLGVHVLDAKLSGESYFLSADISSIGIPKDLGPLSPELPCATDLTECLMSSGVLAFANIDEIRRQINLYRGLKRKACFCPDTNILYRRFFSTTGLIEPKETCVIDIVKSEIQSQLNYKYSPDQINDLKKHLPYNRDLLDEFVNRKMKKARKAAYFANKELAFLREGAMEIASPERGSTDKEGNDWIIAKALRRLETERSVMPVLLTADSSMVEICKGENLEYIHFKMAFGAGEMVATPRQMVDLISELAAVLGVVKLNSIYIFSEFKGKHDIDELKVYFLDNANSETFKRDLRICRKLTDLLGTR